MPQLVFWVFKQLIQRRELCLCLPKRAPAQREHVCLDDIPHRGVDCAQGCFYARLLARLHGVV